MARGPSRITELWVLFNFGNQDKALHKEAFFLPAFSCPFYHHVA